MIMLITQPSYAQSSNNAISILLFGDSIVAGYGLSGGQALSVKVQEYFDANSDYQVKVINGGVSGETTSGGRGRLGFMLDKHKPNILLIALGGNDLLRGIAPVQVQDNVDAMLQIASEKGVPTILSAVVAPGNYGSVYQKQFNSIYPTMAEKYNVPLYPFLLEKVYGKKEFMMRDGIHPNAYGIQIIANDLAPYILSFIE